MVSNTQENTRDEAKSQINAILDSADYAKKFISGASDLDVLTYLVDEHLIDKHHDGEQGIGEVREAILCSNKATFNLKQRVATRGDYTTDLDIFVPDTVYKTALGALESEKPVVLYGPTGTGKTTFAKQLALETCVGYTLATASPSWTSQDIVGRVAPDYSENTVSYRKELGCVSEAIVRAREYNEKYAVIIDELTRADISQIFGELYTAIENPHQTIFKTDENKTIELTPNVQIICTMNMSDRTVNQLDNAITRRFAMIEVSDYDKDSLRDLFTQWATNHLQEANIDDQSVKELFNKDYHRLNNGTGVDDKGIMEFGPMHYRDVVVFLESTTSDGGVYESSSMIAVGEAFRTYILPRLLNPASYSQIDELITHYAELNKEFDQFDLSPAIELARSEQQMQQQRMGMNN
jgi:5-methylcytosine-specific restriction protein B